MATTTDTVLRFDLILRSKGPNQSIEIPVALDLPVVPVIHEPDGRANTIALTTSADIVVGLLAAIRSAASAYLTDVAFPGSPAGTLVLIPNPADDPDETLKSLRTRHLTAVPADLEE